MLVSSIITDLSARIQDPDNIDVSSAVVLQKLNDAISDMAIYLNINYLRELQTQEEIQLSITTRLYNMTGLTSAIHNNRIMSFRRKSDDVYFDEISEQEATNSHVTGTDNFPTYYVFGTTIYGGYDATAALDCYLRFIKAPTIVVSTDNFTTSGLNARYEDLTLLLAESKLWALSITEYAASQATKAITAAMEAIKALNEVAN